MKTYQPFNMDFLISLGITAVGCGWVYVSPLPPTLDSRSMEPPSFEIHIFT
jgi:hypothetical protein